MSAIKQTKKKDHKNTYILYADAEKSFDKFWFTDSLIETKITKLYMAKMI